MLLGDVMLALLNHMSSTYKESSSLVTRVQYKSMTHYKSKKHDNFQSKMLKNLNPTQYTTTTTHAKKCYH